MRLWLLAIGAILLGLFIFFNANQFVFTIIWPLLVIGIVALAVGFVYPSKKTTWVQDKIHACPDCGAELPKDATVCPACGKIPK